MRAHQDRKGTRHSNPLAIVARSDRQARPRRFWIWAAVAEVAVVVFITLTSVLIIVHRSGPWGKAYLIQTLEQRYNAEVRLEDLKVSLYPRVLATGTRLTVRRRGQKQLPPFMSIKSFSAESSWKELLGAPWHVHSVRLVGLEIHVPPRGQSRQPRPRHRPLPDFVIDEIQADGTSLTILPRTLGKLPLTFDIERLLLRSAGKDRHLSFEAKLRNPKPPGEIESRGNFGPWRTDQPSLTPVSGRYTFQNADLSVFNGISGKLSSRGQYNGALEHIAVQGWTDTPDFAVGISGQPIHLRTEFQAVVDGTDGDTYLQPVKAHFLNSTIVATGKIEGTPGVQGKTISLEVAASNARIEDLMRLAVKERRPPMTGAVGLHSVFRLPPGTADIVDKLYLKGDFQLHSARFTNLNVQRKVEALSRRGRGVEGDDDTASVVSNLAGRFQLRNAEMSFPFLSFEVPGGAVRLHGNYGLRSEQLGFHGELRLRAKLSQTTHGIKSLLLKPIDPLFHKKGAGTVLPIKVEGERSNPHFGLDLGRLFSGKSK